MTTIRYAVEAVLSPDVPLRLLNLFAQQALVVERMEAVRQGDAYRICVDVRDLPVPRADVILEKMRAMVMVASADLHEVAGAFSSR